MEDRCRQEEILLREGENNTKFFHCSKIEHKSSNQILRIKDDRGHTYEAHQDIEQVMVQHFQKIAEEPQGDKTEDIQWIVKHISKLVIEENNKNLNKHVSVE